MSMARLGIIIPSLSRDNRSVSGEPEGGYYSPMTKTFRQALIDALTQTGRPLSEIADKSEVSYEQLKKLRQGRSQSTNVDDAIRVANAFGVSLEEFVDDRTVIARTEIVRIYNELEPQERQYLLASAKGIAAERDHDSQKSPEEHPANQ